MHSFLKEIRLPGLRLGTTFAVYPQTSNLFFPSFHHGIPLRIPAAPKLTCFTPSFDNKHKCLVGETGLRLFTFPGVWIIRTDEVGHLKTAQDRSGLKKRSFLIFKLRPTSVLQKCSTIRPATYPRDNDANSPRSMSFVGNPELCKGPA